MPPTDIGFGGLDLILLGSALTHFKLEQSSAQHLHGLVAVTVLRPIVLALHDDTARMVGDSHRRFGLVHVLAARARGAEHIDSQIRRVDIHFDRVIDFGVNVDRCERSVSSATGVERGFAHETMDAGFGTQKTVRVFAFNLDGCALDASHIAGRFFQQLGFEAFAFAVAQILTKQHLRPVLGFGAARARLNFQKAVTGVGRVRKHAPKLEPLHLFAKACCVGLDGDQCVVIALGFGDLGQFGGVAQACFDTLNAVYDLIKLLFFATEFLRLLGVIPDVGRFELAIDFFQAGSFDIEVKDTPEGLAPDARGR